MNSQSISRLIILLLSLLTGAPLQAEVRLPRLLSDGAILQRDKPCEIWGWAKDGEVISVRLQQEVRTVRTQGGRWSVTFPAHAAGGPYTLRVEGENILDVKDLWFGDLWIAAGQSNMELPLRRVATLYPDLITNTQLPRVRQFSVPLSYSFSEVKENYEQGEWKTAVPANLGEFSAVGFFFARELSQRYDIPVGILSLAVGGAPAEAWMSEAALQKYPQYVAGAEMFKDERLLEQTIKRDKINTDTWYQDLEQRDRGRTDPTVWFAKELPLAGWENLQLPGSFKEQRIPFINGVVWLRKHFELQPHQAGAGGELWLGALVDGDETYINSVKVGSTGYRYPPRIYPVPSGLLLAGTNTLAIRLTSYSSDPGAVIGKTYALKIGSTSVDLAGTWRYRIGAYSTAMPSTTTVHYQPTSLFKAKLGPALRWPIKGVIWYQGESNVGRAGAPGGSSEYSDLFPELISDWRQHFRQGEFPFLFVQLANFLEPKDEPAESAWAELREAQRQALRVPNTAMAVAIDTGEWNDLHPLNKKDVGERLALAARKVAYGETGLVASGPLLHSVKRRGKKLILEFTEVGDGLRIRGDRLREIAVAGEDKQFRWASARIQGKQLLVWHPKVAQPVWVRYAWADNPTDANLFNAAGLPAAPFEGQAAPRAERGRVDSAEQGNTE